MNALRSTCGWTTPSPALCAIERTHRCAVRRSRRCPSAGGGSVPAGVRRRRGRWSAPSEARAGWWVACCPSRRSAVHVLGWVRVDSSIDVGKAVHATHRREAAIDRRGRQPLLFDGPHVQLDLWSCGGEHVEGRDRQPIGRRHEGRSGTPRASWRGTGRGRLRLRGGLRRSAPPPRSSRAARARVEGSRVDMAASDIQGQTREHLRRHRCRLGADPAIGATSA